MDAERFWLRQRQKSGNKILASGPVFRNGKVALKANGAGGVNGHHIAVKPTV